MGFIRYLQYDQQSKCIQKNKNRFIKDTFLDEYLLAGRPAKKNPVFFHETKVYRLREYKINHTDGLKKIETRRIDR